MLKLSIPGLVGLLGWLFCGYAAYLFGSTIWKGARPKHAAAWMRFVEKLASWRKRDKGTARYAAVWFGLIMISLFLLVAWRQRPTVEYNVAVVDIEGPYRFTFQPVNDKNELVGKCDNSLSRTCFTSEICQDYASPKDDFPIGIILAQLIHTVESGCWSLNPEKHGGYFKKRYPNRKAMFVGDDPWTTTTQLRQ